MIYVLFVLKQWWLFFQGSYKVAFLNNTFWSTLYFWFTNSLREFQVVKHMKGKQQQFGTKKMTQVDLVGRNDTTVAFCNSCFDLKGPEECIHVTFFWDNSGRLK